MAGLGVAAASGIAQPQADGRGLRGLFASDGDDASEAWEVFNVQPLVSGLATEHLSKSPNYPCQLRGHLRRLLGPEGAR